jgi:hypothetical protein
MKVMVELTNVEVQKLVLSAIIRGYMRVAPRSSWKIKEQKEAIRYVIKSLAADVHAARQDRSLRHDAET